MTWSASYIWWLAAGALVVAELASGTFYLLMLALGAVAGALAAHAGLAGIGQIAVAALAGGGAVGLWHWRRSRNPVSLPASANPDLNLDIGARVQVDTWSADASARIPHRGAEWDARFVGSGVPAPGEHVIHAVEGNCLMLERLLR